MMRRGLILIGLVVLVGVAGLLAAQSRRGSGGAEESLSVEDYTPRSTLVVPEHPVPRAKFPVVDVHSHHRPGVSGARWDTIVGEMDELNLQVLVNLSGGSGDTLSRGVQAIEASAHPGRMVFFANLDFGGGVTPGFGQRAAAQLERDVAAGAVGLKLFKNFGISVRDGQGQRVTVDDTELDPVWEMCARLNIPVLIHTGEPSEFYQPVDRHNERWLELILRPGRRMPSDAYPSFDTMMGERDRMFLRHPNTRFIAAHMAWHANDLARLGAMLDRMPNVVVGTGAILYELGRQPRAARAFFEKYSDRVLFGKDSYVPDEFAYYWRTFETNDEYFDYYRRYHAFWKMYGLGLSDDILRKVYYENALRVVPGIDPSRFPAH
jgi:predicted TIM-barrel fold metal-dependent hydrolase